MHRALPHARLEFQGENYPVGWLKETIGSALWYAFLFAIGASMGLGRMLLPEEQARWIEEHRGMVMMCGFLAQLVANSMTQTGAYEVYVDDVLVFSKLQQGGLPNVQSLATIIRQHLKM